METPPAGTPDSSRTLVPPRLRPGDTVAVVAHSSGLAATFPHVYEAGKRHLRSLLGLNVVEAPHALRDDRWLRRNPEARADDLHWALERPAVKGIVSMIGGADAVRVLPHLDTELIRAHPKAFLGFSDSTAIHLAFVRAGVTSYYGPSVMAGLADLPAFPYTLAALRSTLFGEDAPGEQQAPEEWTEDMPDWADPDWPTRPRRMAQDSRWRWLQGRERAQGPLIGGCMEVLEMVKGTPWWPPADAWEGAVLYFETSEDVPPPQFVEYWLRNYAAQGILTAASGMVFGRPRGYDDESKARMEAGIRRVLEECGRSDMPVAVDLPFGHTLPTLVLPNLRPALLDPGTGSFTLPAAAVSARPD